MKSILLAAMLAAAPATAGDPAHVKAVHDLLQAIQAEKMLRSTTGSTNFPSQKSREAATAKVEAMPPETVYARLSEPAMKLVSTESAQQMTAYLNSSYGKRVVYQLYNHAATYGDVAAPKPTPEEAKELKKPEMKKADAAFKEAEPAIRHETFNLLKQIVNSK